MTLIAAISAVLLVVWFCYACRLIIHGGEEKGCLQSLEEFSMEQFYDPADHEKLHSDYRLASYLLRNASELQPEGQATVEKWMIHIYYTVVRASFLASRWKATRLSAWLRNELTLIVEHMIDSVGESRQFVNS